MRGFSLLETSITLVLFFAGMLVAFSLFEQGTQAFVLGGAHNDLASEARRSLLAIMNEVRLSDAATLDCDSGRTCLNAQGKLVHRDAFCLASLSNWTDTDKFNQVQAGIYWDTYSVVYATCSQPGVLLRQTYQPAGGPYCDVMPGFPGPNFLSDNFSSNIGVKSTRVLSSSVEQFQVYFEDELNALRLNLQLLQRGGRKVGGRQLDQRSHASFWVRLENSAPD